MREDQYKCNICGILKENLMCYNKILYPCDDSMQFLKEKWDIQHIDSSEFHLLCEKCYYKKIFEHPKIQSLIQKQNRKQNKVQELNQSFRIFKPFYDLNEKLKSQTQEYQHLINLDLISKLNELQNSILSLIDEKYQDFIEMIQTNIKNEINLSKESLKSIEKSREEFIKANKELINSGKYNQQEMNEFFDKQISQLQLDQKEEFSKIINELLPYQEQPQNK